MDKHVQLGTDMDADDRTPITDADERDALWATAKTQEQVEAEWQELVSDAEAKQMSPEDYARVFIS